MNHFDIRLTAQELDYVANLLAERPWKESNALLVNIKSQIEYQQKMAAMPQVDPSQAIQPNGHDNVHPINN